MFRVEVSGFGVRAHVGGELDGDGVLGARVRVALLDAGLGEGVLRDRVQGSGFRVRVQGSGSRVQGPGSRVQGPGLRVEG